MLESIFITFKTLKNWWRGSVLLRPSSSWSDSTCIHWTSGHSERPFHKYIQLTRERGLVWSVKVDPHILRTTTCSYKSKCAVVICYLLNYAHVLKGTFCNCTKIVWQGSQMSAPHNHYSQHALDFSRYVDTTMPHKPFLYCSSGNWVVQLSRQRSEMPHTFKQILSLPLTIFIFKPYNKILPRLSLKQHISVVLDHISWLLLVLKITLVVIRASGSCHEPKDKSLFWPGNFVCSLEHFLCGIHLLPLQNIKASVYFSGGSAIEDSKLHSTSKDKTGLHGDLYSYRT